MSPDPLDIIAESYRGIHESTQTIAQATLQMRDTQARLEETQRLGLRLQGFALFLIGATLLFTGYVIWQHLTLRHESAALNQAVLTNTQTIAVQTKALLERLGQR
jgi:hypothetical protein